jgi:SHS2 domain-containing protein
MPHEFLDGVATADIAFRAWADDVEHAFIEASEAMMNVMVEELDAIGGREERRVQLENEELDMLLFDFLESMIYYKDAENLLLRARQVKIVEDPKLTGQDSRFALDSTLAGETIDPAKHRLRVDVKAVTLHRFRLEKTAGGWEAFVILDI